ncbi:MAG: hypothetical protein IPP19_00565 [Verrucomicrobia bacterium]|nr:hypothetical protein [Verrucomicrobiota bacterium]
MKPSLLKGVFVFVALAINALAGPRDTQWALVEESVQNGLPKTAIQQLEPIVAGALADKSYTEAIKAMGQKIVLEGNIQGNKLEDKIVLLQAEMAKVPMAIKPVMEAILADWYWRYFQQNRWRFLQRTQTNGPSGTDIQTWDLAHILDVIDQHFTAALANEAVLKATPVGDYSDLLKAGNAPDQYRPTMYDFIAYQALQFYQAGEQAATVDENEFEIDAASPIFADATEFTVWEPNKTANRSQKLKAIRLYQSLLRFHLADTDRSAFLEADLARLTYGFNNASDEDKADRYKEALQRFINTTAKHEIAARAHAALAAQLNLEGEPTKAHQFAKQGLDAFPTSVGGALCFNLIQQIEIKSAQVETESVWSAPWPTLDITYSNVAKVYFRIVAVDFEHYVEQTQRGIGRVYEGLLNDALAIKPTLEWNADLPQAKAFEQCAVKLPAPTSLKPGFYFVIASHDPTFGKVDNQVSIASFWVSDLALVIQTHIDNATQTGLVLRANSGEPVEGATVRFWQRQNEGLYAPITPTKTDKNGRFQLSTMLFENGRFQFKAHNQPVVVLAEFGGQSVASTHEVYFQSQGIRAHADPLTVFFTDRAIYRPGQTINYKGVSISYDHAAAKYSALANQKLTVVFNDPNGKEIARAEHRTNDYGSFNGVFTAPRDRLMGRMAIRVLGRPSETSVNVEEYKRPKFQVELNAPSEAAKLDKPVVLSGKATAYNGATIGGAKVKWRVERGVQCPYWCWWWRPAATKAIAHGTAVTEPDGTFKLEFAATPDRTIPAKNEPTFTYSIHTDVTDTTGETRSTDRTVRAGYTALQASLTANDWQTPDKPVEFSITTNSLDGAPQPANGTVTIHALKQPAVVERAPLQEVRNWWIYGTAEPKTDPTNPNSWELGNLVVENTFKTDATGKVQLSASLKPGIYRASLVTSDRFGKEVTARQTLQVVGPRDRHFSIKIPNTFSAPKWSAEPGETFTALWGTGYDTGRAFVELECDGKPLKSYWTTAGRTQERITLPVTEELRGGFTVRATYIRENRAYLNERIVDVPWTNKQLAVKWERFRSKLQPGQKETWTAVITGPNSKRTAAEMVATLYDSSLDEFSPHNWPQMYNVFRQEFSRSETVFQNANLVLNTIHSWAWPSRRDIDWNYRTFQNGIASNLWGWEFPRVGESRSSYISKSAFTDEEVIVMSPFEVCADAAVGYYASSTLAGTRLRNNFNDIGSAISVVTKESFPSLDNAEAATPKPDLSKVAARKNLNETAFFFPQLVSDNKGVVRMTFTMPEALTQWKFLGFAHDKQLRSGFITDKVTTSKDLMVEPNPPRFVREGDAIEFTVKVSNQSEQPQVGTVKLTFADAASLKPVDDVLSNHTTEQAFNVPAKQSRSYAWRIVVPEGLGFVTYKAVAATDKFSDGEEGFLPVLSRRILVTESLPMPIRGKSTKQFEFKKLLASGASDTLRHQSLTVQMTSQPAWYAVMALPYLMEYPYECSEQTFNRFYANALARHIANSDPKIRRIFDLWKNTPALDSPLDKNQDLKSVMLEETPWLREAKAETQARRNIGLLFDDNRLDEEATRTLAKLSERQLSDGLWSWFPGGRSSEYISLYIATGFGRLRHLGVVVDVAPAVKAFAALDASMTESYRQIQKNHHPENYVPGCTEALYLYGRSFFLNDQPITPQHREAVDFFLKQARKSWLKLASRQSQAHLALALNRFGDKETAQAIVKSLKERSVSDEELGLFWRNAELSWWWYDAPIETQALMIEAFAEVTNDTQAVEDCKVWLLIQKQTQDWKTTKATADAIYGLLLHGSNLLGSDALVEVALAGRTIKPEKVEAGTGFYEKKFASAEINPAMGQISVKKADEGVSWGSVHWQYLEDIAKITPHEGTPLKLRKTLWIKETTSKGQVLKPVTSPLAVGDELVVRIELRSDRDMEFVHLKDQRGSGTEPVNVLSRYKYQDGLGYYESTRDTASHFFIEYLRKGVYVFEYSTRVQLKGAYQTGIAEIQCMYAPEFNSHSESVAIEVK